MLITIKAALPAIFKTTKKQLDLSVDERNLNHNILALKYKEDELKQYSWEQYAQIKSIKEEGDSDETRTIQKNYSHLWGTHLRPLESRSVDNYPKCVQHNK